MPSTTAAAINRTAGAAVSRAATVEGNMPIAYATTAAPPVAATHRRTSNPLSVLLSTIAWASPSTVPSAAPASSTALSVTAGVVPAVSAPARGTEKPMNSPIVTATNHRRISGVPRGNVGIDRRPVNVNSTRTEDADNTVRGKCRW
jgi:hypothetical protein